MDQKAAVRGPVGYTPDPNVTEPGATDTRFDRGDAGLRKIWWLVMLVGVAGVVAGIVLLAEPKNSLSALTVIVGIVVLLDAVMALFMALLGDARNATLSAIAGVLGIIVGIALIRNPLGGVNLVGILIGLWLVAAGAIGLARAIGEHRHRILRAVIAVVEIAAGIVVVSEPRIGYTALAVIAGIWLIVSGIATIVFAVSVHRAA